MQALQDIVVQPTGLPNLSSNDPLYRFINEAWLIMRGGQPSLVDPAGTGVNIKSILFHRGVNPESLAAAATTLISNNCFAADQFAWTVDFKIGATSPPVVLATLTIDSPIGLVVQRFQY